MKTNVFKREEKKYLLSYKQYTKLLSLIKNNLMEDDYPHETICNLYFDSDYNELIIKSLDKPLYKEKVRLRSYGIINNDEDIVYFEIKKKYKGTVNKRRIPIKYKDYNKYLKGNYTSNEQIFKEIDYLVKYYHLLPKIFIAYERDSYLMKNEDIRITFDHNIRKRRDNLDIKDISGELLHQNKEVLMEIKTLGSLPMWFIKVLEKIDIYPRSFSKYGSIYMKERIENYV